MLTIDEEEKHGEYKSDNIEALQVHFCNDEDYLGRGRSAFQEDEASKYFRDDWHLDPFGNNFVSVETDSKNLILQYKEGMNTCSEQYLGRFLNSKMCLLMIHGGIKIRIRPKGLWDPMNSSIRSLLIQVGNGLMCQMI